MYQYKDIWGNIRLTYSDADKNGSISQSEIKREQNYYPFGLKHKGYNSVVTSTNPAQDFKYNGKELQDELGLNTYDYGARMYDPALGRWMNLDPLAELMMTYSPYNYAFGNPIYFIDPSGLAPFESINPEIPNFNNGPERITGYYSDDKGRVFFDPNVNENTVLPTGYNYIGKTYTSPSGVVWDEEGNPSTDPTEELDEVIVFSIIWKKDSSKKKGGATISGAGDSQTDTASNDRTPTDSYEFQDIAGGAFSKLWEILINYFRKNKKQSKKDSMENKVEKDAKNVPKKVIIAIKKTIIIAPPHGNNGLRITTITDSIEAFPKDTARLRELSEKVLDSIRKSYYE